MNTRQPADSVGTDEGVDFVTDVNKSAKNLPVGISPDGVRVFGYTDKPGFTDTVLTIPFGSIDEARIVKETRLRRVLTTTGWLVALIAYGAFGSLVGYNLLQGRVTGTGAILFGVTGPLALLCTLFAPFVYFTRLGYFLHIRVGRRWMRCEFQPAFWDEHGEQVSGYLSRNVSSVKLLTD